MKFFAPCETPQQSEAATAHRVPVVAALCRRVSNCDPRNLFDEASKTAPLSGAFLE